MVARKTIIMTAAETQMNTNDKLSFFGMLISLFIIPILAAGGIHRTPETP